MLPDLAGLKVAVDVQHLYRDGIHTNDRGTLYELAAGGTAWESDCALHYSQALTARLLEWGATVITNEVRSGIFVGPYLNRQQAAMALGAAVYVACHLNAGRGGYALCEYADGGVGAALGRAIVHELQFLPGVNDGRVVALREGDRGLVCVRGFKSGPAVIVEPLFGDNPAHQALMSLAGLEQVGAAIGRGVANWWRASRTTPLVT